MVLAVMRVRELDGGVRHVEVKERYCSFRTRSTVLRNGLLLRRQRIGGSPEGERGERSRDLPLDRQALIISRGGGPLRAKAVEVFTAFFC